MKEIVIYRKHNSDLNATIDDQFFDDISKTIWYAAPKSDQLIYAFATENNKTIYMHRKVMELHLNRSLENKEEVDHIDNNGLNNQLNNLRVVNRSQNQSNQRRHRDSKSEYVGVYYNKRYTNPYRVKLMLDGKNIHINKGFDTAEDAAEVRDLLSLKYFGNYAKLNFPERRNEFLIRLKSGYNPDENTRTYSSNYIGVTYNSSSGKWMATIYPSGKQLYIGLFDTEIEAAEQVDMANIVMTTNDFQLNFEEKRTEYTNKLTSGYSQIITDKLKKRLDKMNKQKSVNIMSFIT